MILSKAQATIVRFAAGCAMFAGVACFHAWTRVEATRRGYELSEQTKEHTTRSRERARLELEAASLRAPGRIEQLARVKLGMGPPRADQIVELVGGELVSADRVAAQR